MSPRPAPTRHDATAMMFLNAGAQLIDAMLTGTDLSGRLKSLHYPAPLDWIRVEDVLRVTQSTGGEDHRKAFRNRWATKDGYIRDCFLHALLYRDSGGRTLQNRAMLHDRLADPYVLFAERITEVATIISAQLLSTPRSYLLAHASALLGQNPEWREALVSPIHEDQSAWIAAYGGALATTGARLRPGWTLERLTAALQALTDGIVVRHGLGVNLPSGAAWEAGSLYADAAVAIIASVVDADDNGLAVDEWLNVRLATTYGPESSDSPRPRAAGDAASGS